jgi:hypothetical protein
MCGRRRTIDMDDGLMGNPLRETRLFSAQVAQSQRDKHSTFQPDMGTLTLVQDDL